ncbi:hypothetical protein BaRGS_00009860 [Batillaria attramentaria]|uniref:Uncharacterized protein n=1 Tax=Batillaria attramentaria TaxID=370345 RepID=A0ABD0LI44_9CAEN
MFLSGLNSRWLHCNWEQSGSRGHGKSGANPVSSGPQLKCQLGAMLAGPDMSCSSHGAACPPCQTGRGHGLTGRPRASWSPSGGCPAASRRLSFRLNKHVLQQYLVSRSCVRDKVTMADYRLLHSSPGVDQGDVVRWPGDTYQRYQDAQGGCINDECLMFRANANHDVI